MHIYEYYEGLFVSKTGLEQFSFKNIAEVWLHVHNVSF